MAGIVLQQLQKTYDRYAAVRELNIEIVDGEFLVLLGPSGCGKTTTLNMIAGLETPTSGRVLFDGEDVTNVSAYRRNVAMVFQSALLYPHLNVRRNIETSLRHSGLSRTEKDRRIADVVRMLEIEALLDKLPAQMSGGQRQRVATAKAIVREPAAFLLDEPLSALDAALRLSLRSELVNLQKRIATTTIFVTHDQIEAMTMGDRIAVMAGGHLEQIGTPEEIYSEPATLFVAGFLGSPPMNLIEGEVAAGCFRSSQLSVPAACPPGRGTLGVRPQDTRIAPADEDNALPGTVFAIEHLGRESVVIVDAGTGAKLRVLVPPGFPVRIGDRLGLVPNPDRCLLFDRNGARVALRFVVSA
jgi:ABC-type sugar transport system ATPase subunit